MNLRGLCIFYSVALVPVNLLCASWLLREALALAGMTCQEFFTAPPSRSAGLGPERDRKTLIRSFRKISSDPARSARLMQWYSAALLPGMAALALAAFTSAYRVPAADALTGNVILSVVNAAIAVWGKIDTVRHQLDPVTAEKLVEKRQKEREERRIHWKKYAVLGVATALIFLGVMYLFAGTTLRTEVPPQPVEVGSVSAKQRLFQWGCFGFLLLCLLWRLHYLKRKQAPPARPAAGEKTEQSSGGQALSAQEDAIFRDVCKTVRAVRARHPSVGYVVRWEREGGWNAENPTPRHGNAWFFVSLCRNGTILESGAETGEWPGVCVETMRIRRGKVTVLPLDAGVFSAELEAITADYEESGGDYVENRQASAEILAQASRVEWIDG